MEEVVFIIGGNMGNRSDLISKAKYLLQDSLGDPILLSSIYETAAWGKKSSGDYLNQVLVFDSDFSPHELLAIGQNIENSLGRIRVEKWTDRTMDVDILYIGQKIVYHPDLAIPHPHIAQRRFVLEPVTEVLPDFIHPVFKLTNQQLLENCGDNSAVRIFIKK